MNHDSKQDPADDKRTTDIATQTRLDTRRDTPPATPPADERTGENQGEGNVKAARRYNEASRRHAEEADIESEARAAAPKDGAEAQVLRDAEAEGLSRSRDDDPKGSG